MQPTATKKAIGCATILPAALIGFAGLNDGIGPQGWRGFAEFFGWVAVCLATSWLVSKMIARANAWWAYAVCALLAAGFAYLLNWLGLDAPMIAKEAFTSTMQLAGSAAFCCGLIGIVYLVWAGRKQ